MIDYLSTQKSKMACTELDFEADKLRMKGELTMMMAEL